jgi:membrane protein required for colicin V production
MNKTLPFTDKEDLEDSMLYEPIKSLVPTIFPLILEKKFEIIDSSENKA